MYSLRANPSNIATFLRILGEGKRLLCGAEGDSIGTNTLGRGETIRTGGLGLFARGGEVSLNSLAIGVRRSDKERVKLQLDLICILFQMSELRS